MAAVGVQDVHGVAPMLLAHCWHIQVVHRLILVLIQLLSEHGWWLLQIGVGVEFVGDNLRRPFHLLDWLKAVVARVYRYLRERRIRRQLVELVSLLSRDVLGSLPSTQMAKL